MNISITNKPYIDLFIVFTRLSKAVKTAMDTNQLLIPIPNVAYLTF